MQLLLLSSGSTQNVMSPDTSGGMTSLQIENSDTADNEISVFLLQ